VTVYWIERDLRFEAAHVLTDHEGKCSRLHGHSWLARVRFQHDSLCELGSSRGMLLDFADVAKVLQVLHDEFLDHRHLNDSLGIYPTCENIAKWIFDRVRETSVGGFLLGVVVEETCTSRGCYYE